MIGSISLSEVLALRSSDAELYGRCRRCRAIWYLEVPCCGRYDREPLATVRDMLDNKRNHEHYVELRDSIGRHGMAIPVLISEGVLINGGHRIAVADELNIESIPYTDDWAIGWEEGYPDELYDCRD